MVQIAKTFLRHMTSNQSFLVCEWPPGAQWTWAVGGFDLVIPYSSALGFQGPHRELSTVHKKNKKVCHSFHVVGSCCISYTFSHVSYLIVETRGHIV